MFCFVNMIHGTYMYVLFRESIDSCREEQFLIIDNNQLFTEQVFNVEQTAVESLESMYMMTATRIEKLRPRIKQGAGWQIG